MAPPKMPTLTMTDEPSVMYDTEDNVAVIFRIHASIWPKVLPYCIVNSLVAYAVFAFDSKDVVSIAFSDKGHTFMSAMVSFLLVTRSHIAVHRYTEARNLLSEIMRSCRELVQHTVTFSRYDDSKKAKNWRADIARRTCSMLRAVVSVLRFDTKKEHVWQVAELSKAEKQALLSAVGGCNERSPLVLVTFLRTSIASHVEQLKTDLDVNQELKLLSNTEEFVSAYHGLMKLITTPFSFPLVQMTRTFLFAWIFTLPFALSNDIDELVPLLFCVFFITFGFIGLEFVSIELDNPFGDNPNDFDVDSLARVVFEDIFITIQDLDGEELSKALKKSVEKPLKDQIKNEVKKHKRFTRMSSWGGTSRSSYDSSTKSQTSIDSYQQFTSPPSTITARKKMLSPQSRLLENARVYNHSHTTDGHSNVDSFSVNRTYGSVLSKSQLQKPEGNMQKRQLSFKGLSLNPTPSPLNESSYQNLETDSLGGYSSSSDETFGSDDEENDRGKRDRTSFTKSKKNTPSLEKYTIDRPGDVISSISPITRNSGEYGNIYREESEQSCSFNSSFYSIDSEDFMGQNNIRSNILGGLRNRLDTDASIEVFGVDEKVKLDPKSNKLLVKSKPPVNNYDSEAQTFEPKPDI